MEESNKLRPLKMKKINQTNIVTIKDLTSTFLITKEEIDILSKYRKKETIPSTKNRYTQIAEVIWKNWMYKAIVEHMSNQDYNLYAKAIWEKHLDVWGGDAWKWLRIHEKSGSHVDMVDIYDWDIYPEIKSKIEWNDKLNFTIYDIKEDLPIQDNSYDSASLFFVLHHILDLKERKRRLSEIYNSIKIWGKLIIIEELISEPLETQEKKWKVDRIVNQVLNPQWFDNKFIEWLFYTKEELEYDIKEVGFEINEIIKCQAWKWWIPRCIYILEKQNKSD